MKGLNRKAQISSRKVEMGLKGAVGSVELGSGGGGGGAGGGGGDDDDDDGDSNR